MSTVRPIDSSLQQEHKSTDEITSIVPPRGSSAVAHPTLPVDSGETNVARFRLRLRLRPSEAPLPTVAELTEKVAKLQEKVAELERHKQRVIEIAGGHLKRAEDAESLLEKKPEVLKEIMKEKEELEKKLNILKEEQIEEKKRVADLMNELDEERRRINVLEQKKEALEEKVIELTTEKKEERIMTEENKRLLDESEKEKEELRRRVRELERKLAEEGGEEPMEMMDVGEMADDPFDDNNMDISGVDGMDDDRIENGEEETDTIDHSDPHSDEEEVKKRRSSRNLPRSMKYADSLEESDEEDEPSVKKKRSESVEKKEKTIPQKITSHKRSSNSISGNKKSRENDNDAEKNELECPECEYRSRSANAWYIHLHRKHSTNPALAGCLLRCDCGHESYSNRHSCDCEVSNFTIIRTGDGTIRRLTDPVATPQCVLCKAHPKTPYGYIQHLRGHHKTTLLKNGIFLLCSCGIRYNADQDKLKHDEECNRRDYSLHKRDEE